MEGGSSDDIRSLYTEKHVALPDICDPIGLVSVLPAAVSDRHRKKRFLHGISIIKPCFSAAVLFVLALQPATVQVNRIIAYVQDRLKNISWDMQSNPYLRLYIIGRERKRICRKLLRRL